MQKQTFSKRASIFLNSLLHALKSELKETWKNEKLFRTLLQVFLKTYRK